MTNATSIPPVPGPVSESPPVRPKEVQVEDIGSHSQVLRSQTWDRLKFEVEYGRRRGTTANSYVIHGDKIAVIDPPGESFTTIYLDALQRRISLSDIDYIIASHVNSNRLATLEQLQKLAPQATIICSRPAANTLQTSHMAWTLRPVRTGDSLNLGQGHHLKFVSVPTPRWPDGLCTYDPASEILYSDKLFGAHLCGNSLWDDNWRQLDDDRRYYFDCLHAPQAKQVNTALDQIAAFAPKPKVVAPGHGPLVRYSLSRLHQDYRQWCQDQMQRSVRVALLYASAYGNTATVADAIAQGITAANVTVESINCEQIPAETITEIVAACDGFIIGSPTLGGHAPVQIQTALGTILANVPTTKLAGVFGSYGWSGEAIDLLEQKLRNASYRFGFDPIRVRFSPDADTLSACTAAGTHFAQQLRKRHKQQIPRQATTEAQSDRTAQAMGRILGSLGVVTFEQDGRPDAILTTWVSQATFTPPGIMMALPRHAATQLEPGQSFVLNILKEGRTIRRHFSCQKSSPEALMHLSTQATERGGLVLTEALAYLECSVKTQTATGDHQLIYAQVDRGHLLASEGLSAVQYRKSGMQY